MGEQSFKGTAAYAGCVTGPCVRGMLHSGAR